MFKRSTRLTTRLLWGAVAGAAGATALNAVTYGDMLVRARASSSVPATVAGRLADRLGIAPLASDNDSDAAKNRRSAAGALLGYGTGIGVGVAYGALRSTSGTDHLVRDGVLLGVAAMAMSDAPTAFRISPTDSPPQPRTTPAVDAPARQPVRISHTDIPGVSQASNPDRVCHADR
jgi:hypothetical protein